jgi:hypothetical protein
VPALKLETEIREGQMKRTAVWWAAAGFAIPIFWGAMSFIFFSARESLWTNIYWGTVYVTCPFWLLPTNTLTTVMMPVLNAILYGGIAFFVMRASNKRRKSIDSPV